MDLAYSKEHIDTFAIISGDSDFSPLVSKLKELGKHVIGLGMTESTSDLLRDNCDEFIYYEDLGQAPTLAPALNPQLPETKRKAFSLLLESLLALRRENKEVLWSSMVKDTMKRKKPSFNEAYHGYRSFSELLQDAQKEGLVELDTDIRSRTYVVTRFGAEMAQPVPTASESRRKRRRRTATKKKPESAAAPKSRSRSRGDAPSTEAVPPAVPEAEVSAPAFDEPEPEPGSFGRNVFEPEDRPAREGKRSRRADEPREESAPPERGGAPSSPPSE
jgi:hypothetical protein